MNYEDELRQCDKERDLINTLYPNGLPKVNMVGQLDWEIEKLLIKEEYERSVDIGAVPGGADWIGSAANNYGSYKEEDVSLHDEREFRRNIASIIMQDLVGAATRTEPDYEKCCQRLQDPGVVRLLHAAMGLATEAGELMDAIKRFIYYGAPLDRVNILEEIGDATWYERIAIRELEANYLDVIVRNVKKLQARFPEKFTEQAATVRDLVKERKILEQGEPDEQND